MTRWWVLLLDGGEDVLLVKEVLTYFPVVKLSFTKIVLNCTRAANVARMVPLLFEW